MSTETYHLLTLIGVIIIIVLQLVFLFGPRRVR
jgi:hypothetical protein